MAERHTKTDKAVSVWEDLKRRNVYRVGVGYAAVAWLMIEVAETTFERIGLPSWSVTMVIVVALVGMPVALVLGWILEITPKGIIFDKPNNVRWTTYLVIDLFIVAVLAAAGSIYWFRIHDVDSIEIVQKESSIAVLRFLDLNEGPDFASLGDSLTEEIIHELTNLGSLRVIARTTIWALPQQGLPVPEIAKRLNVGKVLEGSVRSEGRQIRVTAQLIDDEGFHLWSKSYDRLMRDVLDIQKDIATQVVAELNVVLTGDEEARLASRPTHDSAAYVEYLQGRQALREPGTADSLTKAMDFFRAAIELDARFSLAYAGLCRAYLASYRISRSTDDFTEAELACHRSLTLDSGLTDVYVALGDLYRHAGLSAKAEAEYDAALSIHPTLEEANFGLARAYQAQGRLDEAEELLLRGVELEPGYWGTYFGLGNFLHRQGRYFEAVPYYEIVTQMEPGYAGGFINLGSALHWLGDWENAEIAFERALELVPASMAYQNMGTVHYYQGRFEEAVAMHEQAVAVAPQDHRAWGKLAAAQRYVPGLADESQDSYQVATELVNERLAINPDNAEDLAYVSSYLTNTGQLAAAREAIDRALIISPESPRTHYFAALVELSTGDLEQALLEARKAVWNGYSRRLLSADPQFVDLRKNPDFKALISEGAEMRVAR